MNPNTITQGASAIGGGTNLYNPNTGELLKKGETVTINPLATAKPPTTAAQVTPTPSVSLPNLTPSSTSSTPIGGLLSFYQKQFDLYNQQQADYQAQQEKLKATQTEQTAPFLQRLLGSQTPSETRATAMSETGVDAKEYFAAQQAALAEISKLNEDYNAEVAKKDAEIARIQDNAEGKLTNAISEDVARTEQRYAVRLNQMSANLNTKAAIYEAEQGRFAEAQQYVNQAVQDATAETRFNMDMYKTFYDMNQDAIDSIDVKYRDAFKSAMDAAESAYVADYQEKMRTISEAAGIPTSSSNVIDLLQQSIDAGFNPETAARDVVKYYQDTFGITPSIDEINSWTSEARNLKANPQQPTIATPEPVKKSLFSGIFNRPRTTFTPTTQSSSMIPKIYSPETNAQTQEFWSSLFQ